MGLPAAPAPTAGAPAVSGRAGAGLGLGFEGMPTNNDAVGGGGGGLLAGSGMMPQVRLDVYFFRGIGSLCAFLFYYDIFVLI